MNTGEGTCFPLIFHPAALVNGFRNSSKYPDSNLVQFSPSPSWKDVLCSLSFPLLSVGVH